MQPARISYARIPELDGIRAIAIWMVMVMHALVAFPYPASIPKPVLLVIGHGWLGVDLFFVLSGFLITGILLDAKGKPRYFKTFYARRFFRIMPLYFTLVIVWSFFYRSYGSYFVLSSVFLANLAPLFHIRAPHGPSTLWSLAIEEQFYLVWPLLVLLLSRRKLLAVAVALVVLEPFIRGIHAYRGMNAQLIYNLTWCRCDGLALGALFAIWVRSKRFSVKSSYVVAAALLGALLLLTVGGSFWGLMKGYTVASASLRYTQAYMFYGAVFALVLAHQGSIWTAPLRWKFMQLSGALSYCLYLIHVSIGEVYQRLIGNSLGTTMATTLLRAVVMIGTAFLVAMVSKRFLEDPCMRLKDKLFPVVH
jgi:peptidoglycan/LPS O-acetylase OafA/YrhL